MRGVFDVLGCHRVGWNGRRPPLGRASMSNVWLLLFGGVMAPTLTLNNAFEEAFTVNQDVVQSAWKKVVTSSQVRPTQEAFVTH